MTRRSRSSASARSRTARDASSPVSRTTCSAARAQARPSATPTCLPLTKRSRRIAAWPRLAWPSPSWAKTTPQTRPSGNASIVRPASTQPSTISPATPAVSPSQRITSMRAGAGNWASLGSAAGSIAQSSSATASGRAASMPRNRCSTSRHAVSRSRKPLATGG